MSVYLTHPPEKIIRQLLLNLGHGTETGDWTTYYTFQPDAPNNSLCVYGPVGRSGNRDMNSGEKQDFHGIQVRVRAESQDTGYLKAQQIQAALDQDVQRTGVVVSSVGYLIWNMSRSSGIISLGFDGQTRRRLWTMNYLATIQLS